MLIVTAIKYNVLQGKVQISPVLHPMAAVLARRRHGNEGAEDLSFMLPYLEETTSETYHLTSDGAAWMFALRGI